VSSRRRWADPLLRPARARLAGSLRQGPRRSCWSTCNRPTHPRRAVGGDRPPARRWRAPLEAPAVVPRPSAAFTPGDPSAAQPPGPDSRSGAVSDILLPEGGVPAAHNGTAKCGDEQPTATTWPPPHTALGCASRTVEQTAVLTSCSVLQALTPTTNGLGRRAPNPTPHDAQRPPRAARVVHPAAPVGERNAATAMPGNPGPTTTHSPSPQLVKVPSARTGDRPTSPRPVTPTRPARRLSGRPSARARARGGRLRARPPALGPRGPRRPTTPPPIRLLLARRRAVHQQTTRPRQRPRQPSTALHTLTHTQ